MTLEEKAAQMQNDSPAIERLGLPAYDWWKIGRASCRERVYDDV